MIIVVGNGIGGSGSGSGDRLLLVGALDHFQTEHDPGRDVGEILDLATVV
jgi:hypothetical protein